MSNDNSLSAQRQAALKKHQAKRRLHWEAWNQACGQFARMVLTRIKEGRFKVPVEVTICSAQQDVLLHYRLVALEEDGWEILEADDSKWPNPAIFPLEITISSGGEYLETWGIESLLQRIH